MFSLVKGKVIQANDREYVVDLAMRTCDCGHFQENGIPCGHAFSSIYVLNQSPRDSVPDVFTVQIWKNTYLTNLEPVTLVDLPHFTSHNNTLSTRTCNPPVKLRAPAGHPQTVRFTSGSEKKDVA
jgi:hypothetical protein